MTQDTTHTIQTPSSVAKKTQPHQNHPPHYFVVFGTRPEIIKLAPVIHALRANSDSKITCCATGQHREMIAPMLDFFGITPDIDLNLMQPNQTLTDITCLTLQRLAPLFQNHRPDWVIVQGDTTTAFASTLAAFYARIPVAHIEAGLRTYNRYSPWPEDINRRLISPIAAMHYTPTPRAYQFLLNEQIAEDNIYMSGNTVIDALYYVLHQIQTNTTLQHRLSKQFSFLQPKKRLVLVTGHRRENHDGGLARVCEALAKLAQRDDVQIVYPVHLNPNVQQIVKPILHASPVHLIPPLDYVPFIYLMSHSELIITDSGGVQEEAPSLGKPILVTRDTTERQEGIDAGTAELVGTDPHRIYDSAQAILDHRDRYNEKRDALQREYLESISVNSFNSSNSFSSSNLSSLSNSSNPTPSSSSRHSSSQCAELKQDAELKTASHAFNPYGDGQAAQRIVAHLKHYQSIIS